MCVHARSSVGVRKTHQLPAGVTAIGDELELGTGLMLQIITRTRLSVQEAELSMQRRVGDSKHNIPRHYRAILRSPMTGSDDVELAYARDGMYTLDC